MSAPSPLLAAMAQKPVLDLGAVVATKKNVKTSKLARMNEQERVKYLERKMAEEEESKRRKEEMVSTFMKIKVKKEEKFESLNNSKLIEHWRTLLRSAKTSDLQSDVRVLMDSFQRAIRQKSSHIQLLMQDLTESEQQYNLAFRSHVESMSDLQNIHYRRISDLLREHETCVAVAVKRSDMDEDIVSRERGDAEQYLGDVAIATEQRHTTIVDQLKNVHQAIKDETKNKNMEEKQSLHIQLEESLETLWFRLQKSVHAHKTVTEEKRRLYQELLGKDKKGFLEVFENNKKITKLLDDCQRLRDTISEMQELESRRLSAPRKEREELMAELHLIRRKATSSSSGCGGVSDDEDELRDATR